MRKAFILGAGLGTRLRPLTDTLPKPLIPLFNRPLITHALDHCRAAGIEEIAINTHHLPDAWEKAFPTKSYRGMPLTFFHEKILLETGGGIKNIAPWIAGEPLLIYNGDIFCDLPLRKLIQAHQNSNHLATLATLSSGPHLHLHVEKNRVLDISQKLTTRPGNQQFTGIYTIRPELLNLIPPNQKISVIPAFLEAIHQNRLGAVTVDGSSWLDLGTRQTYLEAAFSRPPEIHPSAKIHATAIIQNSWIGPNTTIGQNTTITNSILWPQTTVAPETSLENCIVHSTSPVTGNHQNTDL